MNNSVHYRSCNLCEAICGIEITSAGDQHLNIRGDKDDPFSRGYICPKAVAHFAGSNVFFINWPGARAPGFMLSPASQARFISIVMLSFCLPLNGKRHE